MEKELAKVGPQAIPWLIKGLEEKDSGIHKVKVWIWRKLSPTQRQKWRNYAPIEARTMRSQCAYGLRLFGPEAVAAVPKLMRMTESDPDTFARYIARSALSPMASRSPEAMAALIRWLREGDSVSRAEVAGFFYSAELAPKEALPLLLAQLENYQQGKLTSDKPLNEMLAISLYGPEAAPAGPLVVKYITRGEGRGNALNALRAAGPGALPALPRLLQILEEPSQPGEASRKMTPGIFAVLRSMGPAASAALPTLTNGLSDANGVVRGLAAAGIGNITGDYDFAVPLLVKELENRNFGDDDVSFSFHGRNLSLGLNQRQLAAKLLGEIGPPATNALPNLILTLNSRDMWLPAFAAEAIWRISGDADALLPSLLASLNHSDKSRKLLTLRVLTAMGPAAKSALPAIRAVMGSDMHVRREAFEALEAVQRIDH
jgi:HEAT repeat protein